MDSKELTVFNNTELGYQLRMAGSIDKPLFCLKDVCDNLGIKQPTRVAKRLSEEDKIIININNKVILNHPIIKAGNPNLIFITEPALYEVLATTNKEAGKKFRNDLCYKVLPKLRKLAIPKIKTAKQSDLKEVKMLEILKEIFNMNNQELTVFNNTEFKCSIRSLTIDGEQHWAGVDVAKYLGLKSPSVAITELIPAKYKKEVMVETSKNLAGSFETNVDNSNLNNSLKNLKTKTMFINRAGLLTLILKSKKLNSDAKVEWLIEKVLNNTVPKLTDAQFDKLLKARVEKARAEHQAELNKEQSSHIDWFELFTNQRTGDELRYYHFNCCKIRDFFILDDLARIFRLNERSCEMLCDYGVELNGELPLAHKQEVRAKGINIKGLTYLCEQVKKDYKNKTERIINRHGRFLPKKLNIKLGWIYDIISKTKQLKLMLEKDETEKLAEEVKKLRLIKEKKLLTMEIKALDEAETTANDNLLNRLNKR